MWRKQNLEMYAVALPLTWTKKALYVGLHGVEHIGLVVGMSVPGYRGWLFKSRH